MQTADETIAASPPGLNSSVDRQSIPLLDETATVEKQAVDSGSARVRISVSERDEMVQALLSRQDVTIERVQVGQIVETAPTVRHVGDTVIIPILEEVVVTQTKLMLREELHIRITQTTQTHTETVRLRREAAEIDQADTPPAQFFERTAP